MLMKKTKKSTLWKRRCCWIANGASRRCREKWKEEEEAECGGK
jgi:hypothetical protein